jgi:hypothetical protein
MMNIRVLVGCRDASGTPGLVGTNISCTMEQYHNGEHYDAARAKMLVRLYEITDFAVDENDQPDVFDHIFGLVSLPFYLDNQP